jgi:hypothetical protein
MQTFEIVAGAFMLFIGIVLFELMPFYSGVLVFSGGFLLGAGSG